jgi:hypothetical protein
MGGKPRFGSFLFMNPSSVIISQIDVDGIAFDVTDVKQCLTIVAHSPRSPDEG